MQKDGLTAGLERETRFELAPSTLARLHSTTELFPQNHVKDQKGGGDTRIRTGDGGFADLCLSPLAMSPLERETRFELATSTLARLHSTTELLPRAGYLASGIVVIGVTQKSVNSF